MNTNTPSTPATMTAKLSEASLRFNIDAIRAVLNSSGSDAERLRSFTRSSTHRAKSRQHQPKTEN